MACLPAGGHWDTSIPPSLNKEHCISHKNLWPGHCKRKRAPDQLGSILRTRAHPLFPPGSHGGNEPRRALSAAIFLAPLQLLKALKIFRAEVAESEQLTSESIHFDFISFSKPQDGPRARGRHPAIFGWRRPRSTAQIHP